MRKMSVTKVADPLWESVTDRPAPAHEEDLLFEAQGMAPGVWRVVYYSGSMLSIHRDHTSGSQSIGAHIERGTASVLFQGTMEDLVRLYPRSHGDVLRGSDPFPGTQMVAFYFQRQCGGMWVTASHDPRPYARDVIKDLLECSALRLRNSIRRLGWCAALSVTCVLLALTDVEQVVAGWLF